MNAPTRWQYILAVRIPPLLLAFAMGCSSNKAAPWSPDEAHAFETARQQHKGVMVELYASWAVPCDELDHELRSDSAARLIEKSFVPVKIDVSDGSDESTAIRARYKAETLPAAVFVSTTGQVVGRITVLPNEGELSDLIARAAAALPAPPASARRFTP